MTATIRAVSRLMILAAWLLPGCTLNLNNEADKGAADDQVGVQVVGVQAVLRGNTVAVTWKAHPSASLYEVARRVAAPSSAPARRLLQKVGLRGAAANSWTTIATPADTRFGDTLTDPGTYEYRVRATSTDGTQTLWSESASVRYIGSGNGGGDPGGNPGGNPGGTPFAGTTDLSGAWTLMDLDLISTLRTGSLWVDCPGTECSLTWSFDVDYQNDGLSQGDTTCFYEGTFTPAQSAIEPAWYVDFCDVWDDLNGWSALTPAAGPFAYRRVTASRLDFAGFVYGLDAPEIYPFGSATWVHFPGDVFDLSAPVKVVGAWGLDGFDGPLEIQYQDETPLVGDGTADVDSWWGEMAVDPTAGTLSVAWWLREIQDGATAARTRPAFAGTSLWSYSHDATAEVLVVDGVTYHSLDYWLALCCTPYPFETTQWYHFPGGAYDLSAEHLFVQVQQVQPGPEREILALFQHDVTGDATLDVETWTGIITVDEIAGTIDFVSVSHTLQDGQTGALTTLAAPTSWAYAYDGATETLVLDGVTYRPDTYWENLGGGQIGSGSYAAAETAYAWDAAADGASGTELIAAGADDVTATFTFPFAVTFYGVTYTELTVSSNGFVQFGANSSTYCCSAQIPNDFLLAGFALNWADLRVQDAGSVRYAVTGTAPNRRVVVTYYDMAEFGGPDVGDRYQWSVEEAQPDRFIVHYQTVLIVGFTGTNLGDAATYTAWAPLNGAAFEVVPQ